VVSHDEMNFENLFAIAEFQSPDGDSVVSHSSASQQLRRHWRTFQSPDGDSVVSHDRKSGLTPISRTSSFSPLTGIPWFPTPRGIAGTMKPAPSFQSPDGDSVVSHAEPHEDRNGQMIIWFQSPDGDSVVSHRPGPPRVAAGRPARFQSPDGDSVVSHQVEKEIEEVLQRNKFQSPDGDSVVSHVSARSKWPGPRVAFQSPDGDSVVSHDRNQQPMVHAPVPVSVP